MEVTTDNQKLPEISTNSVKSSVFSRRPKKASAKGWSPPQELEVSPRAVPSSDCHVNKEYARGDISFCHFNCFV